MKVGPEAWLGTEFQGLILVKAGEKGLRVKSFDCHLVFADIEVREEVVDAPMVLTASVESPTVLWENETSTRSDIQLEPGETKELPFTLQIPADLPSSEERHPERRWTLTVKLSWDAPRPMEASTL